MAQFLPSFLFLLLQLATHISPSASRVYSIATFGAKPYLESNSAEPLLRTWAAACSSAGSSTVHVPAGRFFVGHVTFSGPCKSGRIRIQLDGSLVAPGNYNGAGKNRHWLVFDRVDGVSIHGGTIDGSGSPLWSCKAGEGTCPDGATSLTFSNSKNILVRGLTSVNSKLYHIVFNGCQNVTVEAVRIRAPANSPNTDGIHVQMSRNTTITRTDIRTGDDCISIGPGTINLWIEHVSCGPGHGISIGSLGKGREEKGVENVMVRSAVFKGSTNGLRIKTWGKPSEGFVRGVVFEHVLMRDVKNPIIIDQNYCPNREDCPNENSGVKISEVTYNDIQGSSTTQVAMNFACSAIEPCSEIGLRNIKLTYGDKPAKSECENVGGTASGYVIPASCL